MTSMDRVRQKTLIVFAIAVVVLIISTGCASAQDVPSHTQVSPGPSSGFDFPTQLTFFASLATYSNGIIANVTQGNFSNAATLLASYNSTIDSLNAAATNAQEGTVMAALKASRDDFSTFISSARRYSDLYVNETSLSPADARSNASVANALEMNALNGTLKGLQSTIQGRNADIYGVAVNSGLDLSKYGNATALFNTYATQVDSRFANVTAKVYQTPTLTLTANKNNATYGDVIMLVGGLQANQTAITNSSIDIHVDNTTVATVSTNATGSYKYQLVIRTIAPGRHVAFSKYTPANVPYNPAQSPKLNFSVAKSSATNTLTSISGSIGLVGNLQAQGRLMSPKGPVPNATVALFVGGTDVAQTQTDQNGTYAFSVPTTGYYLPALLSGTTAYTVFDPSGQPLDRAMSAAVHIPADFTGVYGIIVAVVLVVLLGIFLYIRGFGRRAPSAIPPEAVAKPAGGPPIKRREIRAVPPPPAPPPAAKPVIDWNAARDQARDAFRQGDDELATTTLFDAAVASLSATAHVRLATHMTHSEKSWAIQAALPDVKAPMRELTTAYELVNYGGRSLTQAQRDAARNAFDSLRGHVKSTEKRP